MLFRSPSGRLVRAPVDGRVSFVGWVAGVAYVSIRTGDEPGDATATIGGLVQWDVAPGATIRAGAPLGRSGSEPVTLSLRRFAGRTDEVYLDPEPWLGRKGVRLLPNDGSPPRSGRSVCRVPR